MRAFSWRGKFKEEAAFYSPNGWRRGLIAWFVKPPKVRIGRLVKTCRACEYWQGRASKISSIVYRLLERRLYRLGANLNVEIYPGSFGPGLRIYHYGIVVHNKAKIGKNCTLHGNNCIGNIGREAGCPVIGDDVDIGFGAVVIGNINIPNRTIIASNAVVCKSIEGEGHIIAGVPAKIIK